MSIFIRSFFFAGDILFLNLSIAFSYLTLGHTFLGDELVNSVYLFIFSNLAWIFLILISNPYLFSRRSGIVKFLKSQLIFLFVHLLLVASLIFFFKKRYTLPQIGMMYLFFSLSFFSWKLVVLYVINLFKGQSMEVKNLVIIGHDDLARETRKYFLMHPELNYRFLGMFHKSDSDSIEQIQRFCIIRDVHEIYCRSSELSDQELKKLIDFGLNRLIKIKVIEDHQPSGRQALELDRHERSEILSIGTVPLDDKKRQMVKRVFDLVFSFGVILIILSWLVPIISIAIKIDSKGPIFFRQKRAGKGNAPFMCLKFRTMIINQEADTKQATKNDSRITRFGKFLRKSSLDEIPQFFNVLIGDMSIIGPRPHPIKLNEQFAPMIEILMSRHYVKPGITGLAQSMGYRGETKDVGDMENRVKLDRFYIENWSFFLDLKIIAQTVVSLLRGSENAY